MVSSEIVSGLATQLSGCFGHNTWDRSRGRCDGVGGFTRGFSIALSALGLPRGSYGPNLEDRARKRFPQNPEYNK